MARTGAQTYPGASTAYSYSRAYPGSAMETNTIVWHSTEGTSLPSYGGGTSAPNLTAKPDFARKRLVWYQHFGFDESARALMNQSGGVQTNTLNVCQVEIVGTCDPSTHAKWEKAGYQHLYMPELPDWAIRDLAAFAKWAHDVHGVPLTSNVTWKAYPGSYGASGVRMSAAKWTNFEGHCGHQHVPENDHGDPGLFPMSAILAAAKGGTTPTPSQEDDMPTADEIATAVLKKDGVISVPGAPATNPTWTLSSVQTEILKRLDKANATLTAQAAAVESLTRTVAQLATNSADLDADALVARVQAAIDSIHVDLVVNSGPASKEA